MCILHRRRKTQTKIKSPYSCFKHNFGVQMRKAAKKTQDFWSHSVRATKDCISSTVEFLAQGLSVEIPTNATQGN